MNTRRLCIHQGEKGAALTIAVLFFLIISIAVAMGVVGPLVRELRGGQNLLKSKASYFLAEAGSEDVVYRLKTGKSVSSVEALAIDGNTVSTTITNVGSNEKQIIAQGDVSDHIRSVRIDLTTSTGVAFAYGAQVGEGGMDMEPNSRVEGASGAVGNVYSNGPISGVSSAVVTGDATVATNITEDVQARSTVCNQDKDVGKENPTIDFAQSFKPGDSQPLAKVSLYIKKVGSPSSRTVKIVADAVGSPGTTALASGTLNAGLVGANYSWVDVVFSSPPSLTAGQTYWIVLDASRSSSKYWVWCSDSNNGFGNGVAKYSEDWDSNPWTIITGDLAFKTYLGAGVNAIDGIAVNGTARANTITNSAIGGDAYYQTISGSSVGGTSYPGSADPAVLNMPVSQANIDEWKADASAGGFTTGSCPGSAGCSLSMGAVKINGDLTLTNNQAFTVNGTIHVTGNFVTENGSAISCAVGYGDDSCVVVVDGWVDVSNNVTFSGSSNPDSYILILSTVTGCLGGDQTPGCGPQNSGIYISNNAIGALFYAPSSQIYINNNVDITSVVGYKLKLQNNAVVKYEIGAANVNFSAGPGGGWKVKVWRETE